MSGTHMHVGFCFMRVAVALAAEDDTLVIGVN